VPEITSIYIQMMLEHFMHTYVQMMMILCFIIFIEKAGSSSNVCYNWKLPGSNCAQDTDYPELLNDFLQSFQANGWTVHKIMPCPPFSTSFTLHYSLVIVPLDTMHSELLRTLLDKP
jgi:hypothetical protein